MIEPEGHLGHWAGKCYLLKGISQDLRFSSWREQLFTYEDDVRWKWAELVESVEKGCKAGMFALWMRWDFWLHHEARTSPEPWGLWMCLCEWARTHTYTHTHTRPDVHLASQMISNFIQFLNISLFGTAATSYGTFHYAQSKTHTYSHTHTYPFIHLLIYLYLNFCCSLFIACNSVVFALKLGRHDQMNLM